MLPDAGDPPLVEQERLDRRAAAARQRAQLAPVKLAVERLDAQPRGEERVAARRRRAPARRCRSGAGRRSAARGRRRGAKRTRGVRAARRRVVEQRAGHPQVHEQERRRPRAPTPGTCRAAPARSIAPALDRVRELARAPAARTSAGRGSPARSSTRPSTSGRELAADRLDLGKLGHALRYERLRPAKLVGAVRGPVSQRRTLAPTSASGPSWRRPSAARRTTASSGACSRVWSVRGVRRVAAVVGGQDEQVAVAQPARASRRPRRRSRAARRGSPRRPCGGRRPGRSRPGSRRRGRRRARRAARSSPRAPAALVAPGCCVVDADARRRGRATLPTACTGDAGVLQLLEVACAPGGGTAKSRRPVGALRRRRARPSNGRAITRPTACSPVITRARPPRTRAYSSSSASTSSWAASWSTESCRGVEDQLAGRRWCSPKSLDRPRCRCAGGCSRTRGPVARSSARDDLGREAVGVGRQRRRRHDAHQLPVAGGRVLARARAGAGGRGATGAPAGGTPGERQDRCRGRARSSVGQVAARRPPRARCASVLVPASP